MADSPDSVADAANFTEQWDGQGPRNLEASPACRSDPSPVRKRKNNSESNRNKKRSRYYSSSILCPIRKTVIVMTLWAVRPHPLRSRIRPRPIPTSPSSSEDRKEKENRPSTSENVSEAPNGAEYVRFEVEDDSQKKWSLPENMTSYISKKFSHFVPDKVLYEKILDKYPLPSSASIKASKLDDYVPEIFSATNASYGKSYDTNLHQIQGRIGAVMGPLSRIWHDLDNIQSGRESGDSLDPSEWLNVVEKAITLLGQAFTSTTYHRRMTILYGPRQANLVLIAYASSEASGEPAHPRSLARTFAARSYKQRVKRNLQTESQIRGPSEWLGMRS